MIPLVGDVVFIGRACGVQFGGNALRVRVTKVERFTHTPEHMLYLAGYVLNQAGEAVEKRPMLLVEHAGLELLYRPPAAAARRARNAGPVVPRQRVNPSAKAAPKPGEVKPVTG